MLLSVAMVAINLPLLELKLKVICKKVRRHGNQKVYKILLYIMIHRVSRGI